MRIVWKVLAYVLAGFGGLLLAGAMVQFGKGLETWNIAAGNAMAALIAASWAAYKYGTPGRARVTVAQRHTHRSKAGLYDELAWAQFNISPKNRFWSNWAIWLMAVAMIAFWVMPPDALSEGFYGVLK